MTRLPELNSEFYHKISSVCKYSGKNSMKLTSTITENLASHLRDALLSSAKASKVFCCGRIRIREELGSVHPMSSVECQAWIGSYFKYNPSKWIFVRYDIHEHDGVDLVCYPLGFGHPTNHDKQQPVS